MFCRCEEGGKYSFVKETKKGERKAREYLEKGTIQGLFINNVIFFSLRTL